MPITVPKLEPTNEPDTLPSNPRLNENVPNDASEITQRGQELGGVIQQTAQVYQQAENNTITSLSYQAEHQYTAWQAQKLQDLKNYQGDPTDAYAQFDQDSQDKMKDILAQRPDLSDRVQSALESNLNRVAQQQQLAVIKQRGAQQSTFDNNLFESTVKLKKDNLGINAGYIQKDDPSSFLPMDQNINDLKTVIAKRAVDQGTATVLPDDAKSWNHIYEDDDGTTVKVNFSDITKQRVAQELSTGIGASINSMLAAGYTDQAKEAMGHYQDYLDPKTDASLNNKFQVSGVKNEAYSEIGKIQGLSDDDQIKAIQAVQDPQLKSEMLKIKDTNDRYIQDMRDRKQKQNYDYIGSHILQVQNSDTPYHGLADLQNDPKYQGVYDNLSVKDKKAVIEMVNAPKTTNPNSEAKVQDLFFGNDPTNKIENMSPTDFAQYTVGLSKADKNKYTNMYNRQNMQSAGDERAMYKQAGSMLQNQMLIDGRIQQDSYGKITGDDQTTLLKAQNGLIDALDKQGKMDPKQLKDFVQSYSSGTIKASVFSPTPKPVFNTPTTGTAPTTSTQGPPSATPTIAPAGKNEVVLSPLQIVNYKKNFKQQYGYFPTADDAKFKTYVQNNK